MTTLHVFADRGLMLPETAGVDPGKLAGVRYTAYRQHRLPGPSARCWQLVHILARPWNLRLSAWAARHFNARLRVEPAQLQAGLDAIADGDAVLWLNPSLALAPVIETLQRRHALRLSLYFLDPVHRLGWTPEQVRTWVRRHGVRSYWPEEAARLSMQFLAPYAPSVRADAAPAREFDVVYVGSPTPKRLLWLLLLTLQLRRRGGRGYLRLASRNTLLPRLLPGVFSERVAFADYAALCARARGVLELHERDAGGVTLRATLCEALGSAHLCNQACTPQTLRLSLWRWGAFDAFLRPRLPTPPPKLHALAFEAWLRRHFS